MRHLKANRVARLREILRELLRRRVVRTTGAYLVAIWALTQGVTDLFPAVGLPDWSVRVFVLAGLLATPLVAVLAWRYDITLRGIVKEAWGLPGSPEADRVPNDVTQWALAQHDLAGTGCLSVSWCCRGGEAQSRRFFDPVIVGRDVHNDVYLPDPHVSRRHVVLWAEKGTWWARDLESSNGTYVDGNRVTTSPLPPHCQMQFGRDGPVLELATDNTERTLVSPDR